MNLPHQIANHLKGVYFGGNWTSVDLKNTLSDVTWEQAVKKVDSFNTIAALTYHVSYYVTALLNVLHGEPLDAKDKYSFSHPSVGSEEEWHTLLNKAWADAENCIALLANMPESKLWEDFTDKKYGNYYDNITGIIEHIHYHLGQIVLIKKLVSQTLVL